MTIGPTQGLYIHVPTIYLSNDLYIYRATMDIEIIWFVIFYKSPMMSKTIKTPR